MKRSIESKEGSVLLFVGDEAKIAKSYPHTIIINGNKCKGIEGLYEEFAHVLKFPHYFSNNPDSFDECLTDMKWLGMTEYIILINEAQDFLKDSEDMVEVILEIFSNASLEWENKQIPFIVLFNCGPNFKEHVVKRFTDANFQVSWIIC